MYEQFKAKAEAAGNTEVKRFGTKAEALAFIEENLKKEDVRNDPGYYAVWAECPFLDGVDTKALAAKTPGLSFEVTPESARNSRIGITQMEWGLANMGTMAQDSTKVAQRLASALPWIHIALLSTNNIIADIPALMTKMHPDKSNYIALISGPSKTADIERVLAIGVHGPERVLIVCVDELGGRN